MIILILLPSGSTVESPEDDSSPASVKSIVKQAARGLPSSFGNRHETDNTQDPRPTSVPTTLKTMINMFPEVKLLQPNGQQVFWVGVEIEGVLHHRHELSDPSIDVVFIIDNG